MIARRWFLRTIGSLAAGATTAKALGAKVPLEGWRGKLFTGGALPEKGCDLTLSGGKTQPIQRLVYDRISKACEGLRKRYENFRMTRMKDSSLDELFRYSSWCGALTYCKVCLQMEVEWRAREYGWPVGLTICFACIDRLPLLKWVEWRDPRDAFGSWLIDRSDGYAVEADGVSELISGQQNW